MARTTEETKATDEVVTMKASDLAALIARLEKLETNPQGGITMDALAAAFSKSQGDMIQELKTVGVFPEIAEKDYKPVTDNNPTGEPKLKHVNARGVEREVFWHTTLDPILQSNEEIAAWNKIQNDCEARDGLWTARVDKTGPKPGGRLIVRTNDLTMDARHNMPSELAVATELAGGERTMDHASLLAAYKALAAKVSKLEGAAEAAA